LPKKLGRQVITQEMGVVQGWALHRYRHDAGRQRAGNRLPGAHDSSGEEIGIFEDEVLSVIEPNSAAAFADAAHAAGIRPETD
jgi:hypothetical protein